MKNYPVSQSHIPVGARDLILVVGSAVGIATLLLGLLTFFGSANHQTSASPPLSSPLTPDPGVIGAPCGRGSPSDEGASTWGPTRSIYQFQSSQPRTAVLNSVVDTPGYGDERTFLDEKNSAITSSGSFCDEMNVVDGELVSLRTYVDNDSNNQTTAARDVELSLYTSGDRVSSHHSIWSVITSPNTSPKSLFDSTDLYADHPFRVDFVSGSGRIYSNFMPGGIAVSDELWGSSALIGSEAADGLLGATDVHSVFVVAKVRVTFVDDTDT